MKSSKNGAMKRRGFLKAILPATVGTVVVATSVVSGIAQALTAPKLYSFTNLNITVGGMDLVGLAQAEIIGIRRWGEDETDASLRKRMRDHIVDQVSVGFTRDGKFISSKLISRGPRRRKNVG